jgi:D-alanine-D-alanine ligase
MNIVILQGGISAEREISIKSAAQVANSLEKSGHNVTLVDIINELQFEINNTKKSILELALLNPDIVFNALHGKFGEDGQIQTLLDIMKLKYTGSGALASALGMNKAKCYEIMDKFDIDVPKTYEIQSLKEVDYLDLPFPLFIKPNNGGSSIASGKVDNESQLLTLVEEGLSHSDMVLVQEMLVGVEYTCPVLGSGGHAIALPVGLIKTNNEFFDFHAKYESNQTEEIFPAPIDEKTFKTIQDISLEVHKILGCKGISRSDFIVCQERIVFLEINTSPGMTASSLCPKSALAHGLNMEQLLNKIVNDALES